MYRVFLYSLCVFIALNVGCNRYVKAIIIRMIPNSCLRKKPGSRPDMVEPVTAPARDGRNKILKDLKSKFASLWCMSVADIVKKNMVVKERQMAWCMLKSITITKNGTMSSPQPTPNHVAIIPIMIPKAMIKRAS